MKLKTKIIGKDIKDKVNRKWLTNNYQKKLNTKWQSIEKYIKVEEKSTIETNETLNSFSFLR